MVVHVDANDPGDDLRYARINLIGRRIQPSRPEQHGAAGPHRSRQESSSRMTVTTIFQHTAHRTSFAMAPGSPRIQLSPDEQVHLTGAGLFWSKRSVRRAGRKVRAHVGPYP
jgi:hypothetical protein